MPVLPVLRGAQRSRRSALRGVPGLGELLVDGQEEAIRAGAGVRGDDAASDTTERPSRPREGAATPEEGWATAMILLYDGYEAVSFDNRAEAERYFVLMAAVRCSTHVRMRENGTILRDHTHGRHQPQRCWCTPPSHEPLTFSPHRHNQHPKVDWKDRGPVTDIAQEIANARDGYSSWPSLWVPGDALGVEELPGAGFVQTFPDGSASYWFRMGDVGWPARDVQIAKTHVERKYRESRSGAL